MLTHCYGTAISRPSTSTVGGIDTDEIQNGFQNRRERSHVSYLNTVGPEWAGGPSTFGTLFTRRSSVLSICRWLYTSI